MGEEEGEESPSALPFPPVTPQRGLSWYYCFVQMEKRRGGMKFLLLLLFRPPPFGMTALQEGKPEATSKRTGTAETQARRRRKSEWCCPQLPPPCEISYY